MLTRQLIPRKNRSPLETRRRQSRHEVLNRFNFLRATISMGRYKPWRWWQKKKPAYRIWEYRNL